MEISHPRKVALMLLHFREHVSDISYVYVVNYREPFEFFNSLFSILWIADKQVAILSKYFSNLDISR